MLSRLIDIDVKQADRQGGSTLSRLIDIDVKQADRRGLYTLSGMMDKGGVEQADRH